MGQPHLKNLVSIHFHEGLISARDLALDALSYDTPILSLLAPVGLLVRERHWSTTPQLIGVWQFHVHRGLFRRLEINLTVRRVE